MTTKDGIVTYRGRLGVPPPEGAAPAPAAARPPPGRTDDRSFLVRCGAAARGDMRCFDGVRGLASAAVVVFHSYVVGSTGQPDEYQALVRSHPFVAVAAVGGTLAVDVFLVLSATLATRHLIKLLEGGYPGPRGGMAAARDYWRRRARRMLPAYSAVLAALLGMGAAGWEGMRPEAATARTFQFKVCPENVGRHAMFVGNYGRRPGHACGGHLWSTAVTVHCYAALPLLLLALRPGAPGFRPRLAAALAAAAAAGTAWRVWAAGALPDLHLPLGAFTRDASEVAAFWSILRLYYPTHARAAQLALGALLGLLLRCEGLMSWLEARLGLVSAAAWAAYAVQAYFFTRWPVWGLPGEALWEPRAARLYVALAGWGSPGVSLVVICSMLALMLRADPVHAALAALGSSRIAKAWADLSFETYLVADLCRVLALQLLLPTGWLPALAARAPAAALAASAAATLGVGCAVAYVLRAVLRPVSRWL